MTHKIDSPEATKTGDGARPCQSCTHALRIGSALRCNLSPALYLCKEERAMSRVMAFVLHACGQSGRFFSPAQVSTSFPAPEGQERQACSAPG